MSLSWNTNTPAYHVNDEEISFMKLTPEFPPLSSYSVASVLKLLIRVTDALDKLD
jgi:hypothetical protein